MMYEIFLLLLAVSFATMIVGLVKIRALLLLGGILLLVVGIITLGEGITVESGWIETTNTTNNISEYYNATGSIVNTTEDIESNVTRTSSYTLVYGNENEMLSYVLIFVGLISCFAYGIGFIDSGGEEDDEEEYEYEYS